MATPSKGGRISPPLGIYYGDATCFNGAPANQAWDTLIYAYGASLWIVQGEDVGKEFFRRDRAEDESYYLESGL